MDAAGEKAAHIGRIYWNGRPAGAKTVSSSGGKVEYRTGTVTFANGGTTVDIGLQGVSSSAGHIAQPDGSFGPKVTLTGGGGGITTSAWNTATFSTGTVSLTHGDLVSVVWDMTARAGADSVVITPMPYHFGSNVPAGFPTTNANASAAWQTAAGSGAGRMPNVVITSDDGTIGTIDWSFPCSSVTTDVFKGADATNEKGMLFQVPFDCNIDALCCYGGATDGNADFTLKLYSTPTVTPGLVTSVTVEALNVGTAATDNFIAELVTEVSLSKNIDYAVTMLATGTTNSRLLNYTLGNTAHRALYPFGTTLAKVSRGGSTGSFTAENPAVTMYNIGVRVSQINDTAGISRARAAGGF